MYKVTETFSQKLYEQKVFFPNLIDTSQVCHAELLHQNKFTVIVLELPPLIN